ncbi:MAG: hypothetical protein IJA60_02820 [Clostridia bacterium]|nr:hypothetical protein [Clostridia bacterium]
MISEELLKKAVIEACRQDIEKIEGVDCKDMDSATLSEKIKRILSEKYARE